MKGRKPILTGKLKSARTFVSNTPRILFYSMLLITCRQLCDTYLNTGYQSGCSWVPNYIKFSPLFVIANNAHPRSQKDINIFIKFLFFHSWICLASYRFPMLCVQIYLIKVQLKKKTIAFRNIRLGRMKSVSF